MPYCANAECKEPYDKVLNRISGLTYFAIDNGEWCCGYECYKKEMARRFQVTPALDMKVTLDILSEKLAPIGIMPRKLWLEQRFEEVRSAIQRYEMSAYPVPEEWISELCSLAEQLVHFKEERMYGNWKANGS
jgi:hypothetical protein